MTVDRLVYPLISLILLWLVWETVSHFGWLNPTIFPPPSRFVPYAIDANFEFGIGFAKTNFWTSVTASLLRVLTGMGLGLVFAMLLGILIAKSQRLGQFTLPIMRLLAPIAPIAWIPLALAMFGVGDGAAVFIVFMGVAFILTIATRVAIEDVSSDYINVSKTLGASTSQIWWWVIAPAILPQVFTMLRLNFFAAWMAVLAAEMVGLKSGLGAVMLVGRDSANGNLILIAMCLIGVTGFAIDSLLLQIQKRFLWWGDQLK